jgi:hypothetical protein
MAVLLNQGLNERGVSESIGFLLIFTIVIAGIGLVTLYGYPMLLQQQVSADEKIMEKNMIVLQNDIKSLAYKTVPYKETSLKIGSGSLTVYNSNYNPSSSAITILDSSGAPIYLTSFKPGELRFESVVAQTDISLQDGAVILRPRINQGSTNGSVMLSQPRWFYDAPTKTLVVNLINITSTDLMAKEGIGTVRMKLVEPNSPSPPFYPPSHAVNITFNSDCTQDYSLAWSNYFRNSLGMTGPQGSCGSHDYKLDNVDRLVIKTYEVKIESI